MKGETATCPVCGKAFRKRRKDKKYDSKVCRDKAYWEKNQEKRRADKRRYDATHREERRAYGAKDRACRRDRIKEQQHRWYERNSKRVREDERQRRGTQNILRMAAQLEKLEAV